MKNINEMSEQEVIDEITSLEKELEVAKAYFQDDEKYEQLYESSIDRLFDLDIALTHNYPKLV